MKPTLIDQSYEIFQTTFAKNQGVCIIAKRGSVQKVFTNDDQYLIAVETKIKQNIHIIIGAYFKQS